ncbi:MAG: lipopolysaccharide biosynthesis protein [Solirubrobacterales bacterium]
MTDEENRREPGEVEVLETTARRALWWSVTNNVVGRVGTTLIGIVLARILSPEDYGVYAVALVVLNVLLSVNELGVSLAIVRRPGDVSAIAPTVGTLSLATSLLMWAIIFAVAPAIAGALGIADAAGVIRVLALAIVVDALTAVPAALMTRDFMQKERLIVDTAGFVATSAISLALAAGGAGPWALVWGALLGNVVNAAFILRYAPQRFGFGFRPAVARELLGFGLPLAGASLLIIALLEIDYVVIGAELGAVSLGLYLLAFNLSTWPVNMFSAPARRISLPLFARLHNGETSASEAFVPVCCALLLVTLPACILLAVFAEPLVDIVYGEQWLDSAQVLPWLMVLAFTRVLGELVYDFLVALGMSRTNLALQAVWLVALVVALPIAVRVDGIVGVGIAHAGVAITIVLPPMRSSSGAPASRCGGGRAARAALAGGVLGAAAGICAVALISDGIVQVAIGAALVAGIYLVVVYPMRAMLTAPLAGSA